MSFRLKNTAPFTHHFRVPVPNRELLFDLSMSYRLTNNRDEEMDDDDDVCTVPGTMKLAQHGTNRVTRSTLGRKTLCGTAVDGVETE